MAESMSPEGWKPIYEEFRTLEQRLREAEQSIIDHQAAFFQEVRRSEAAEQALKQAAESYVVALDVSEQTWRKEVEAAEQRAERNQDAALETGRQLQDAKDQLRWGQERAERYKATLTSLHDWVDALNNDAPGEVGDRIVCWICHETGYDANGIKHTDDCLLIKARAALAEPQETEGK